MRSDESGTGTYGGGQPASPRGRIVIAEDDREMRRLLVGAFRKHGWDVIELADGVQLADYLADLVLDEGDVTPPEAIVSDIRMPGFSGLEVLHELALSQWAPPVVLITAFGDDVIRQEAKRLGAAAVVEKPLDLDELREVVESFVLAA